MWAHLHRSLTAEQWEELRAVWSVAEDNGVSSTIETSKQYQARGKRST